jgi:hypothetical protein
LPRTYRGRFPFDERLRRSSTALDHQTSGDPFMTITISNLTPIIALASGIGILIWPRLLNYIVAGYLILTGVLGLGLFKF